MVSLLNSARLCAPPAPPQQGPSGPRAEHTPVVLCEPGTPRPDTREREGGPTSLSAARRRDSALDKQTGPQWEGPAGSRAGGGPAPAPAGPASGYFPGSACSSSAGQVWVLLA